MGIGEEVNLMGRGWNIILTQGRVALIAWIGVICTELFIITMVD